MDRRYIGLMFIVLGLGLAGAIIYFLFFFDWNKQSVVTQPTPVVQTTKTSAVTQPKVEPVKKIIEVKPQIAPKEVGEEDLKMMAGLFAERYGSFSNQSNYRNMRDLEIFMTEQLKNKTEGYINNEIAKKTDNSIYFGISTKAVSQTVVSLNKELGVAKITVGTQRRESYATGNNNSGYGQNIDIMFKKEGGVWRVDEAVWMQR